MVASGKVPPPLPFSFPFPFPLKSFISVGPFTAGVPPRMSDRRLDFVWLLGQTTVRVCANAGMPDKQNQIKAAMFNKFLRYGTTRAEICRSCVCMRLRSETIFGRGVPPSGIPTYDWPSGNRANVVAPVWSTRHGTFDRATCWNLLKANIRHAVVAVYEGMKKLARGNLSKVPNVVPT